jgi:hypothetical protein
MLGPGLTRQVTDTLIYFFGLILHHHVFCFQVMGYERAMYFKKEESQPPFQYFGMGSGARSKSL